MSIKQSGQLLVELLIAIAIAAIILPALFYGLIISTSSKAQEIQNLQAGVLLKEGGEAIRSVREASWNNISTNGNYHPVIAAGAWSLVANPESINQYTRTITIADAQRDSSGNLVTSGGTVDPSTKQITVTVSWITPSTSQVSSTFYLTRYLNNQAILQPSPNPFSTYSPDTSSNVIVSSNSVGLDTAGTGRGDWCALSPNVIFRYNIPGQAPANAIWAVSWLTNPAIDQAFIGMGNNNSSVDFLSLGMLDINPPNPPFVISTGTFNNHYKTNAVFGEQGFGYIATNNNFNHVAILNTNNFPPTQIGSVNLGTPRSATSVFVIGNTGYVTAANNLYTFDLTIHSGNKAPLSSFQLSGDASKIFVVDVGGSRYAFVAINSATNQLQIVDVTNRTAMVSAGSLTVNGGNGTGIYGSADGLRAYLVTSQSSTQPEFFIIDTTNKSSPSVVGTYDINLNGGNTMSPRNVNMVLSKNRALIVGSGGTEQYVVLDIRNEASPARCTGMAVSDGTAYDVSAIVEPDGDAYAFIVTSDPSNEFQIIEGGPGNQYATSGVYESATFDTSSIVSFNRLQATFDQPTGTNITFQVASAPPNGGNCNGVTFSYQTPTNITTSTSGTTTTYNGVIPYITTGAYQNPGRCFRYRATLIPSGDFKSTPTLQTVRINYAP